MTRLRWLELMIEDGVVSGRRVLPTASIEATRDRWRRPPKARNLPDMAVKRTGLAGIAAPIATR